MSTKLKVKVCGMREPENMVAVARQGVDYMGFIFYEKSGRYVGPSLDVTALDDQPYVEKVGVFVNASTDFIIEQVKKYGFGLVQLHGDETPDQCKEVRQAGVAVIKAFSVGDSFDFDLLQPYKPWCDFFLFDTKGKSYGGNGVAFDWNVLKDYDNERPIFLSRGLDLQNIETSKN